MTKEEIGSILRNLRTSAGMTQKEAAEAIGRKQQIIGHWETGYSQPDANTLFELCDIYGADINYAFGFTKKSVVLTGRERAVIDAFRSLPQMQNAVCKLLNVEYDSATEYSTGSDDTRASWNGNLTEEEEVALVRARHAAHRDGVGLSSISAKEGKEPSTTTKSELA